MFVSQPPKLTRRSSRQWLPFDEQRTNLRSEHNHLHGSLIHRLPAELKNLIFKLLLPSRDEWGAIGNPSRVIMPLCLTSVCRSWRDIAWSNPLLWSTIHISLGKKVSTSHSNRINFVHKWILRSRTMPLTLHIVVHDGLEEGMESLLDTISQSSNRWHSLSLEIPSVEVLPTFQHRNFQCRLLKRLRIYSREQRREKIDQIPVAFLNSEVSPEKIETRGISFQSLQISWNHLSSATVRQFTLDEIKDLFQHALQMTYCHIDSLLPCARDFSMPPIKHERLKTLCLFSAVFMGVGTILLDSLTLPSLQEFHGQELVNLPPVSRLARRSSCPLTRINLLLCVETNRGILDNLQPLPGVTDLVVPAALFVESVLVEKLLSGEYFPNLSRLTLRLQPFLSLWKIIISRLLDRKRTRPDTVNEKRYFKILVIDHARIDEFNALLWESDIGEQLKSLKLDVSLREGGFELLTPEI